MTLSAPEYDDPEEDRKTLHASARWSMMGNVLRLRAAVFGGSVLPLSETLLLAFGFSTPLLLWGAALGAIPIVIHLLHRRKHREAPWAAMRFLLAAVKKNTNRLRLEQLLLLILRVLILVLLALGLAQPYAESFGKFFQVEAPTQRVIVIDASYSMGYRGEDATRFDKAREIARDIVEDARQGDAFHLVRLSGSAPRAIIIQPAFQQQQVLDEITQLILTEEPGDLAATLEETIDVLGRAPDIRRKEVYFLSDFQAATWRSGSQDTKPSRDAAPGSASTGDDRIAGARGTLKRISELAEIHLIDVGEFDAPNAAIVSFTSEEPFVAVGRPVGVQISLRNFSSAAAPGQSIELAVDGRLVETKRVDLAAGGEARIDFQVTLQTAGEHGLEARLTSDNLPVDNRRFLSLPARDELRVLLVNGRQAGRDAENATWYLERALAPTTSRQRWEGLTRPTVISESDLAAADLARYDCIVLSNIGLFTEREADILQRYVASGGGLIIGLGDQIKTDNYNQMLYRDGSGLLPVRLGDRRGNARQPETAFNFETDDLTHPIVRPFAGNPGTGLESTLTFEYASIDRGEEPRTRPEPRGKKQAEPAAVSRASLHAPRTALRFEGGDPALVVGDVGRGRVVLFTTSLDVSWSSWAVQRSFPPIVHEAVRFSVAGRWSGRQRLVGESISRAVATASSVQGTVRLPDGSEKSMQSVEDQSVTTLTFDGTLKSGPYEATIGAPVSRTELFAVNVDPRESDLTKFDEQQLQTELMPGIDFEYRTRWETLDTEAGSEGVVSRGGLTRWLLLASLALLFIEQLMAWRFDVGFAALCAAVGCVLVRNAWTWTPIAGVAVLAAVGLAGWWLARNRPSSVT